MLLVPILVMMFCVRHIIHLFDGDGCLCWTELAVKACLRRMSLPQ